MHEIGVWAQPFAVDELSSSGKLEDKNFWIHISIAIDKMQMSY